MTANVFPCAQDGARSLLAPVMVDVRMRTSGVGLLCHGYCRNHDWMTDSIFRGAQETSSVGHAY